MYELKAFDARTRHLLRDLFRSRDVSVEKGQNMFVAGAFHDVVKKKIPWPIDNPTEDIDVVVLV